MYSVFPFLVIKLSMSPKCLGQGPSPQAQGPRRWAPARTLSLAFAPRLLHIDGSQSAQQYTHFHSVLRFFLVRVRARARVFPRGVKG